MFHVKHSFAETEAPEQSVEHVFDPGAAGQAVERRSSRPEIFCLEDEIGRDGSRASDSHACKFGGLAAV